MTRYISKGVLFPFYCLYFDKDSIITRKSVECISTSPDMQEINELCVLLEIVDCFGVFLKSGLQVYNSKVVGDILQKLKVEEIPHLYSAAEENDLFEGLVADDFSHSLLIKVDSLLLVDRHLVEEDAYFTDFYAIQCTMSDAQEPSKSFLKLSDIFTQFRLSRFVQKVYS